MLSEGKKLVLRVGVFPSASETFITLQAIMAIDLGYDIRILVNKKQKVEQSSQPDLINKYGLLEKTFELAHYQPRGRIDRSSSILRLIFKGLPFKVLRTLNYFRFGTEGVGGKYLFQFDAVRDFLDADIIHIQFGSYRFPFDELKSIGLVPGKMITTFHGFDAHFVAEDKQEISEEYRLLFKHGHLFTANSDYLRDKLIALGCPADKARIVPVPVDTDYFYPVQEPVTSEVISLLSIGRLIKLKGHAYGIKAVHALVAKGYKVKYRIIGDGVEMTSLRDLVGELGIEDSVELSGVCGQPEIRQAIQSADILLMTSTYDETGRREAQGAVVGEAQACAVPVVAFRSGGVPSTLRDGESGWLIPENDSSQMAERIGYLIDNPSVRVEMGKAGRSFVEANFSVQITEERWAQIYAQT